MANDPALSYTEVVLVVAPTRRDGNVTRALLAKAGVECELQTDLRAATGSVQVGIGALLVTDISLTDRDMPVLVQALQEQSGWSSVPVIALCREANRSTLVAELLRTLPNVVVLDRPTSTRAMLSAIHAALRGRRWQYQIRDQIADLRRAEAALRGADRRKDEFLATLAHELRNPLAPIRTGLHLLEQSDVDAPQRDRIHAMMSRQMTQMVRLVDELLDVSRIVTGKIVLQRARLDLRDVTHSAIEVAEFAISTGGHRLDARLPARPVFVEGDAARLVQAISNILNNAAKYTPERGVITVTLDDDGKEAILRVADTGLGIPEHMLERVFDMFAQVNQTLDRSQGGLGIGLALVKRLAVLHGGTVSASSDGAHRGSTFVLRLPLAGPAAPQLPPNARSPAPGGALRPLTVLVIDDNADAADALVMLLAGMGHRATAAYGAVQGLARLEAEVPDVVFSDIGMPGMSGFALAAKVRQNSRYDGTTLIAITGWGSEEDRRRARRAGFDFHLTKPADADSVRGVLEGLG